MNTTQNRAGWLLLALTLLNILNLADRSLIIAFSTSIVPELGLSNLQYGLLTGFVFTTVYTVFGLFTGSLADRMHRPRLIATGLALWSALTALTGLTKNFVQIAAARMLIGVGEACLTPAALSMLADRYPPARRAFAGGIYYLGLPIGLGGSFIFASAVGPSLGWRGGFILLGILGVVASLLVLWLMRDPPRGGLDGASAMPALADAPKGSFGESFRAMRHELRVNPALALGLAGITAMVFAQGAGVLDLLWWVRERGYVAVEAQKLTGVIFLAGGILGAVLGGVGCDWAHRRFTAGRLKFLAWTFVVAVPMGVAYRLAPDHTAIFYVLAFANSILFMFLYGPAVTLVQELVPTQHRASAVALFLLTAAMIGGGGGNAAVGWVADRFTTAGIAEPLTWAILTTQSVAFLSIPLMFLAARYQQRTLAGATAAVPATAS